MKEGDPNCFWDVVCVRDKTIQQTMFLFEMTEKLTCSTLPLVCNTEIGDVDSQNHNLMLCKIGLSVVVVKLGNDGLI